MTESALHPRRGSPENGSGRSLVKVTEDLLARISENPDPVEYDLAGEPRRSRRRCATAG
jgi:hypothetical protein